MRARRRPVRFGCIVLWLPARALLVVGPSTSVLLLTLIVIQTNATCTLPSDRAHPIPARVPLELADELVVARYTSPNSHSVEYFFIRVLTPRVP
jgi:hypothetical protein